jgi:hypothetical protein
VKDYYDADIKEAPDSAPAKGYDRAALEATIKQAEPVRLGAADQMADTPVHTQGDEPDCLLQSARMAEHRQTGVDPGLEAFKDPAIEKGIYSPDKGTDLQGFADVMNERPGIEAKLDNASGPQDIKSALDSGDSVIAGVDSYEFYKDQFNLEPNSSGHAVVMTGAEQAPDGHWNFTVNDPNFEQPNMPVNGDRFRSAWEKMDRAMLTVSGKGGA